MRHRLLNKNSSRLGFCVREVVFAVGVAVALGACALTSKAELVEVRYFSPERAALQSRAVFGVGAGRQVRLGRVTSGPNLRERIAHRDTAYELGYYDDLRWAERPETYVRRALGRSLFELHGLRRVFNGASPTLDVEVVAFDDLRLGTVRAARVELKATLYENDGVLFERTLTTDRQVVGDTSAIESLVAAMATALDAAAEDVTLNVQKVLAASQSELRPGSTL